MSQGTMLAPTVNWKRHANGVKKDGKFYTSTEYNPDFVKLAKEINEHRWDKEHQWWVFPGDKEALVREHMLTVFGENGLEIPTVDIDIDLDAYGDFHSAYFKIGKITVAKREGRDALVRLHPNACVISGGFYKKGGSTQHPKLTYAPGTVIRFHKFPKVFLESALQKPGITKVDIREEETSRQS